MKKISDHTLAMQVIFRVLLSLVGGYYLSYLFAVFVADVVLDGRVDDIAAGMMLSFIVYTIAVIVVFSIKTSLKAALFIMLSCGTFLSINLFFQGGGNT